MNRIETITLQDLAAEMCIGGMGYAMSLAAPVTAECFMPATPSNKPLSIKFPQGAVLIGQPTIGPKLPGAGMVLNLPQGFEASDLVDMERVTELVRQRRHEKEQNHLDTLFARRGDYSTARVA